MANERYENLDGLRTLSCLGIIVMHIQANTDYQITGWVFETLIPACTFFVFLFLIISGFGMFCGYYHRFRSGNYDLAQFYSRRYAKILPFFASLIALDVLLERSASHLIEGLTELTLVYGLLPNSDLSVIGVSWTLGVIFLFYMLFPFFVWLCWTKKRAWISLGISLVLNLFCEFYFFTDRFVVAGFTKRINFLFCSPFFLCGGLIYLYRHEIRRILSRHKAPALTGCLLITAVYLLAVYPRMKMNLLGPAMLLLFGSWLCCAIGLESRLLSNRVVRYFSGISLECYLAHMVIFRVVEKAGCLYLFGDGWLSYLLVTVLVVAGLLLFVETWKRLWKLAEARLRKGQTT